MSRTLYQADLHLHTCLSPCGDLEMSPRAIVRTAIEKELDIIAVTDHNSIGNVRAVMDAAAGTSLTVLPGMEISSREEVHVVALFPDLDAAENVQDKIYATLSDSEDDAYIQEQILATGDDEVEGFCSKLLMAASGFSLRKLVELIHSVEGLAIAAHIDRQAFGIIGQLGFIPPRVHFDALEISWRESIQAARNRFPEFNGYTFVTSSDAHYLADIGKTRTLFHMARPDFAEIRAALAGTGGCHVEYRAA